MSTKPKSNNDGGSSILELFIITYTAYALVMWWMGYFAH
jgi:hypothetical protein